MGQEAMTSQPVKGAPDMVNAMLSGQPITVLDLGLAAADHSSIFVIPSTTEREIFLAAITERRIIDLRSVYGEMQDAVNKVWNDGESIVLTDEDAEWMSPAPDAKWPFVSRPMVSMVGWYQLEDDTAVVVMEDGQDYEAIMVIWDRSGGKFLALGQRCSIHCDEDGWQVAIRTWPSSTGAHDERIRGMGPEAWELLLNTELPGISRRPAGTTNFMLSLVLVVLVANSIVTADPTTAITRKSPARLVTANRKRGRPSPRAMTWLDLPELSYKRSTGTFTAKRGGGVAWHMVRGHWRSLSSPRFTRKSGQKVWVSPHFKGRREDGSSGSGYRVHKP